MSKNTQSGGSLLAKLFPTFAKTFLENASQDDVLKAEQEAAVVHQQLQTTEEKPGPVAETTPPATPAAVVPTTTTPDVLTAMTTRATTAEARVTELEGQLATAQADRDKYKAWHDKASAGGTKLPSLDAANRNQPETAPLSAASADGLALFLKRKAQS